MPNYARRGRKTWNNSASFVRINKKARARLARRSFLSIAVRYFSYTWWKKIFKNAQKLIIALNSLNSEDAQNDSRLITIGCHSTVASYFLPQTFRLIEQENPSYQIRLRHDLSRNIQLAVQQGEIDIAIVINATPVPDLIIKSLANDEFCVWKNSNQKEEKLDKVFCDLSLFQTQSILRKWNNKPTKIVDSNSLELIVRFVNEGLGYGIIPTRVMNLLDMKDSKKVLKTPTFNDTVSLIYRPEFGRHSSEKIIIESLKRSVK